MPDGSRESRDLELGAAMRSWAQTREGLLQTRLDGPFGAGELEPTWILTISGEHLEAVIVLFHGPRVEVTVVWFSAKEDGVYSGREADITPARLAGMLEDVVAMECGAAAPFWLRPVPEG
ncbi:hypothetical protein [Actinoplanes sp. NPDC049802]|uniref:hypothetical protein n=1 Tax=Actinoplanes sp. NPDC049802 TaxID=3154742 RepID=UPI0033C2C4AB